MGVESEGERNGGEGKEGRERGKEEQGRKG